MCVGPFAPDPPEYQAPPPPVAVERPPEQPQRSEADPEQRAARANQRRMIAYATGREDRIRTGPRGLESAPTVGQVTALGQTGRVAA